ncbi:MAG: hypothetical protein PHI16_06600 [Methanocellales archaeon]|nr:hypothetical protein [Methanocellales archaeon]
MTQYDLFIKSQQEVFDAWVHTNYGGEIANKFIRLAIGLKRRGFKHYSPWAIVGRLRFHYDMKYSNQNCDQYKINNNHIAYLSRFAMLKCPELHGFFQCRELGVKKNVGNKAVVVEIKRKEIA